MWQVYYFVAVERQHELQRELDRRRRDADAVQGRIGRVGRVGRMGRIVQRGREMAGRLAVSIGSALDRPLIGPHHS